MEYADFDQRRARADRKCDVAVTAPPRAPTYSRLCRGERCSARGGLQPGAGLCARVRGSRGRSGGDAARPRASARGAARAGNSEKTRPSSETETHENEAAAPSAPVLALPEQRSQESSFTVPVPKSAEPLPRAQEPQSQVASVTVTPPAFNAAYLRNPAPRYPLASRRAGEQGTVTLRVLVSSDGLPARVNIEKTSGWDNLDSAALEAVKGWRFRPARRGTEPVEGWVLVPIVFRLEGPS